MVRILPVTRPGRWSLGLAIALPVLVLIGTSLVGTLYADIPAAGTLGADLAARPLVGGTVLLGVGCGLAALVLAMVAITRFHERSLATFAAVAAGALLLFLLVGEAFGH